MGRNILVVTGSPRKRGNSELLADALIEGALSVGHTVTKFEAAFKSIGGCTACDKCWTKDRACVFTDGFSELEPLLESAEVIVFATPLYWSTVPAQLKAVIDKLYAYLSESRRRPLAIQESVLLVCGECEGVFIFEGVIDMYRGLAEYLKWKNRGIVAVPQVFHAGDVLQTDGLQQARELGTRL